MARRVEVGDKIVDLVASPSGVGTITFVVSHKRDTGEFVLLHDHLQKLAVKLPRRQLVKVIKHRGTNQA